MGYPTSMVSCSSCDNEFDICSSCDTPKIQEEIARVSQENEDLTTKLERLKIKNRKLKKKLRRLTVD